MTKKTDEDILWVENGINPLCATCVKACKQHAGVAVSCKLYESNGTKPVKARSKKAVAKPAVAKDTTNIRARAKAFKITNVETGESVEVKKLKAYNDEILKTSNYKKLLGTINTGKPFEGHIVEKVM